MAQKTSAVRAGANFIVMIAGAVAIALAVKAFIFDVYLIPSGSMETALHGRPDGGDRIFCTKVDYLFRGPRRWEVAVFEFPYESARQSDYYNVSDQYRGTNFVKRIVGLPGETLAIADGDIWVRPQTSIGEFTRPSRPDSVQRGMWLKVYSQTFAHLRGAEWTTWWNANGAAALSNGALEVQSGTTLTYKPLIPVGPDRVMTLLPGIPDRYVLEQPVQLRCTKCTRLFTAMTDAHNIEARCPACGALQDETAVTFYHRRSGLAATGRWAVPPARAAQGEDTAPRQADYHFVPDLRATVDVTPGAGSLTVELTSDARNVACTLGGGQIALRIQDQPAGSAPLNTDARTTLEVYVADGVARVFAAGSAQPLLEAPAGPNKRPAPRALTKSSGVRLTAQGSSVRIHSMCIDRDIYYYSGWEHDRGERFARMNQQGEIFLDDHSFLPMGDHCPSSYDARSWGPVPLSLLRGPARFIWWPPERASLIPAP